MRVSEICLVDCVSRLHDTITYMYVDAYLAKSIFVSFRKNESIVFRSDYVSSLIYHLYNILIRHFYMTMYRICVEDKSNESFAGLRKYVERELGISFDDVDLLFDNLESVVDRLDDEDTSPDVFFTDSFVYNMVDFIDKICECFNGCCFALSDFHDFVIMPKDKFDAEINVSLCVNSIMMSFVNMDYRGKIDVLDKIDSPFFCEYLQRNGWQFMPSSHINFRSYEKEKNGQFKCVSIPMTKDTNDYYSILFNAVKILAEDESATVDDILVKLVCRNMRTALDED